MNDENICDRESMGYQIVLRFKICPTEVFSNSMCPILMKIYGKSASMVNLVVFNTRQHVASRRVF